MARRTWDDGEEVAARIGDQRPERRPIGQEVADGGIPHVAGRRRGLVGPVVVGPRPLLVGWIRDVLQDVELREAEVLDQVPRRVVDVRRAAIHPLVGKILNGLLEGHVGSNAVDEVGQLPAKCIHVHLCLH